MVLFVPPETCKELGLAPAPGEHAPASPHITTHHLPFLGHKVEREEAAYSTDPETKISHCLERTRFQNI